MSGKGTVLVVDDDPDTVDVYETHLRGEYELRTATDARSALAEIDREVDVVLLDRRMPGLDGDDALERIRERGPSCRVAMVTAVEPDVDVVGMGFDDYLHKPVSPAELRDLVDALLERSEYDALLRRYFSLVSTRAVLEADADEAVRGTEEFSTLSRHIDRLKRELDAKLARFDGGDAFVAALAGGHNGGGAGS